MSNRRIQKKRAKALRLRNKAAFLAHLIVVCDPHGEHSRAEHQSVFRALWKLDEPTFLRRIDELVRYRLRYETPFRYMRPRGQG